MDNPTHYIDWVSNIPTWLRVEGDEIVEVGDSHLKNLEEKIKGMSVATAADLLSRSLPNSFVNIKHKDFAVNSTSWMSNQYYGTDNFDKKK